MKNSKFVIDKVAKLFEQSLISSKDIAAELISILRSKRDEIVFKMKLTSKDEFQILSKRVDNLEKKIAELNTKNENLLAINESLGLEEGDIVDQLNALDTKIIKIGDDV